MPLSTRGCDPEPRWRARLGLHVSLVFLTTAAWAVTLRQVQIMFMPMGISAPAVIVSDDMDEMPTLGEMPLATMPEAA